MKFILPRLFGLALIAGIGAFLLAMIFKALLAIALVGTVVHLAIKRFGGRHWKGREQYGMYGYHNPQMQGGKHFNPFGNNVVPVTNAQRNTGIIPIN